MPKILPDMVCRTFDGRCRVCYLHTAACMCTLIPQVDNKTALTVIMHHRETYKTTNTARLACLALQNSDIYIRGLKDNPLQIEHLLNDKEVPLFLTLDDKAKLLSPEFMQEIKSASPDKTFRLVVPDGSWRQAGRMGYREPVLKKMQWVTLPPGPLSRYRLRYEHDAAGLATLEAIARAMTLIDGNDLVEAELLKIFEVMVERTLAARPMKREARPPGT
jgi:DTW domain-containing protein